MVDGCQSVRSREGIKREKHQEKYVMCRNKDCNKQANYWVEAKKPLYCPACKMEQMIDVCHKRCEYVGYTIQPIYGYENNKCRFCVKHRRDIQQVVYLALMRVFGNNVSCRFCVKHKRDIQLVVYLALMRVFGNNVSCRSHFQLSGMVDVCNKHCIHPNCKIRSNYNFEGHSVLYCVTHKLNGMIDVKNRRCETIGCMCQPCYGFPKNSQEGSRAEPKGNILCFTQNEWDD